MRLITSSLRNQLFAAFAAVIVVFGIGVVVAIAHLEEESASTEQVSAATEETSTQQIASSAQELSATADEAQRLISQFTLS